MFRPKAQSLSLFDRSIVRRAIIDSLRKLSPRQVAKNPVMFVVEIGSILTTLVLVRDLIHRASASAPIWFTALVAVWLWFTVIFANFAEAVGLRPAFRDMGRRLAAGGYVVVVPNPLYRTRKAPVLSGPFDFSKPEDRAKLVDLMAPLNNSTKTSDGKTYVAYLDALQQVKTDAKIGVVGYCMGGPYTLFTAAAVPERVGAGVSLHGANLVTDKPDSPHLLVPKIKASYYFGIADNDDQGQPDAKDKLLEAFAAANLLAKIEVYKGCQHGWCVSDGMVYNEAGAERAFREEMALYRNVLV
jgi:carboxymethylenebutenolidase